jgi:hypothetical protein
VLQHSGFLSEGHAGRSPRRATDVDGNHICNLCGRHVALLLVLLAIVIGVPPVSATVATPREDCMRSAGRDNLDNPDPLNIAEFAVEHVESHQGSASDFRQARPSWLLLWVNGLNLAVLFLGHARSVGWSVTTCCHRCLARKSSV